MEEAGFFDIGIYKIILWIIVSPNLRYWVNHLHDLAKNTTSNLLLQLGHKPWLGPQL